LQYSPINVTFLQNELFKRTERIQICYNRLPACFFNMTKFSSFAHKKWFIFHFFFIWIIILLIVILLPWRTSPPDILSSPGFFISLILFCCFFLHAKTVNRSFFLLSFFIIHAFFIFVRGTSFRFIWRTVIICVASIIHTKFRSRTTTFRGTTAVVIRCTYCDHRWLNMASYKLQCIRTHWIALWICIVKCGTRQRWRLMLLREIFFISESFFCSWKNRRKWSSSLSCLLRWFRIIVITPIRWFIQYPRWLKSTFTWSWFHGCLINHSVFIWWWHFKNQCKCVKYSNFLKIFIVDDLFIMLTG